MPLAPICLFVYNRPVHAKKAVEALLKNEAASLSDLIIYSDGPKNERDNTLVEQVRAYVKTIKGFRSVRIVTRPLNVGLADSIIDGVTQTLAQYETIIVVEDDLIVSPFFLKYMNEALSLYKNNSAVISIHGYVYPVQQQLPETFFIRGADCWGWATWRRAWNLFEADGAKLLKELEQRNSTYAFDFNGTYPYTRMLKKQIKKKNNSWAVRWYASAFLQGKLTLYPKTSLVQNSGFDNTGTHEGVTTDFAVQLASRPVAVQPILVEESVEARRAFMHYFAQLKKNRRKLTSLAARIIHRIKKYFY